MMATIECLRTTNPGDFMDTEEMVALSNTIETKEFRVSVLESEVKKMCLILIS